VTKSPVIPERTFAWIHPVDKLLIFYASNQAGEFSRNFKRIFYRLVYILKIQEKHSFRKHAFKNPGNNTVIGSPE